MSWHLDLSPDLADHALAVDEEGRAFDPHIFPAIHALLHPDAVSLADQTLLVRGEREGELELGLELVVARHRIAGDADHGGLHLAEVGQRVAKGARLSGA